MNTPLTFEQATKICNTFSFLAGKPYDKDFVHARCIEAVVVAPYEELAQQDFVDNYDQLGYTDLNAYNCSEGYDVILITRYEHDQEICLWMDLRSFVKKNIMKVAEYHKTTILATGTEGGIAA